MLLRAGSHCLQEGALSESLFRSPWLPQETKEGLLSPLTIFELLEGQAKDGRCKEICAATDGNDKSRFYEDPNGLSVRTAPLNEAAQV